MSMFSAVRSIEQKATDFVLINASHITKVLIALLLVQMVFLFITFYVWGPTISPDTLRYLHLASIVMRGEFPFSEFFSPGYPFFIASLCTMFNLGLEQAAFMADALCYTFAFFLLYKIVQVITDISHRIQVILIVLLLINSWWFIKILFSAHADGFWMVFNLAIFYCVIRFQKTERIIWFAGAAALGAIGVWIKYNSLIYIPYLAIVPVLMFGWRKRSLLGALPVILISTSFYLFKVVNGSVIHHLDTANKSRVLWDNETSLYTLWTNLSDVGNVLLGSIFTGAIEVVIPESIRIIVSIVFMTWVAWLTVTSIGKRDLAVIMLTFSAGYILGLGLLSQLSIHTEMTSRTLFPSLIILLLVVVYKAFCTKNRIAIWLVFVFVILQPVRAMAGIVDWYTKVSMGSFVLAHDELDNTPVTKRLIEVMKVKGISPENVYTNRDQNLTIFFKYRLVKKYYERNFFEQGKSRILQPKEVEDQCLRVKSDIIKGESLLVLFHVNRRALSCFFGETQLKIEQINDNFIVYRSSGVE